MCYTVKKQCNHYNSVNHNISHFWYEIIGCNLSTSVKSFRINFHEITGVAWVKQVWASSLWWEAWDSGTSWLSGIVWLIIIRPQQLNNLVFTDQGHLIFKGLHPSNCSVPCSRLAGSLKALPDERPSLRELCLRSFSLFYYVMAGGFYTPIFKSTRRFGGWAGGWLIHCCGHHRLTACIAQSLKEDEEVEKTTLSETLNTSSSTFKHLTFKQVFPREPYRLKVHRDAQYLPKPPMESGFSDTKAPSSYQISQRMCLETEELARRSAIYASLADSMVASVIEELSPKDQRSKLLREKLAIIQEAQVSAVSAGFAAASNLQLLRRDGLLKNFGFQPQVLSTVRTAPFQGSQILGPEPKELQNRVRAIRQAYRIAGSSVTFVQKPKETSTKGTQGCQPVRNFRILYGIYMQNKGVRIWPTKYGNWALSVLSHKVLLPEQSLPVLGCKSVKICGILCPKTFKYLFNHQNIQSSLFHM